MIDKFAVRNYKCLRDVTVDLERFTIFVGPNASGKSSILQALNFFSLAFQVDHPQNDEKLRELREGLSRETEDQIELGAEIGSRAFRYLTHSQGLLTSKPPQGAQENRTVASNLAASDWKPWSRLQSPTVPLAVLLRLEASKLVIPDQDPSADPTVMETDGKGLHSALASMTLNDPDSWQALQADLKRIIPNIRRLRHTKATQTQKSTSVLFDTVGAESLPASQVSEGTLLVLGLLTALHAPNRPGLMLLDDLDRGLHPKAQRELISLLRELLKTKPDLQIVASTHSPYLLDCMEVNEVRMTFLKDDGATMCAPLASHPNFPKWKDEMTPGEMWSLFGEKWVAEQEVGA